MFWYGRRIFAPLPALHPLLEPRHLYPPVLTPLAVSSVALGQDKPVGPHEDHDERDHHHRKLDPFLGLKEREHLYGADAHHAHQREYQYRYVVCPAHLRQSTVVGRSLRASG